MGNKADRTLSRPKKITGPNGETIFVGGLLFERSDWAVPVKPDTCCYTVSSSYQQPKGLTAPVKSCKLEGSALNSHQILRKEFTTVITLTFILTIC